jgi:hypothetical protein
VDGNQVSFSQFLDASFIVYKGVKGIKSCQGYILDGDGKVQWIQTFI